MRTKEQKLKLLQKMWKEQDEQFKKMMEYSKPFFSIIERNAARIYETESDGYDGIVIWFTDFEASKKEWQWLSRGWPWVNGVVTREVVSKEDLSDIELMGLRLRWGNVDEVKERRVFKDKLLSYL